jgi:catalase
MTLEQAKKFRYSVFDLTKVWSHKEYPLRQIGKITLNRNPGNYFTEVEQAAFSPSHLVPGMEPSNDPVLQARLFSYPDAHRYRLTINYNNLPVNCPVTGITNFHRDGVMAGITNNGGSSSNYPNPAAPLIYKPRPYTLQQISEPAEDVKMMYFTSDVTDLDFEQPRDLWEKVFDDAQRERYVSVSQVCLSTQSHPN